MLRRPAAVLALLTLLAAAPARAQRPDPSFGVGGRLVYGVPDTLPAYLPVAALVPLPDGRFLTVGAGSMMRFSVDGRRDRTFGQNGRVRETRIRGAIRDARIDDAGRIVAAGEEVLAVFESCGDDIESDFAAARFDADGRVDPAFGTNGGVRVDFPRPLTFAAPASAAPASSAPATAAGGCIAGAAEMTDDMAFRLAIGAGGTVALAGRTATLRGRAYGALARLDATGRLDPTFGTGGRVVLPDGFPRALGGLAALPDGGYIASGAIPGVGIGVVRLHADGRLDASFGRGGLAVVSVAGFDEDPRFGGGALARLSDGGAAAAGVVGGEIVVVRVDAQGLPDARFGAAGIVRLPANGARVSALGVDALGRFVMTGQIGGSAFLMRLSSGGAVEISRPLETGGDVGAASIGTALLPRADGSVVVGGGVWSMPGGLPRLDAFVAVVGADGGGVPDRAR